MNAQRQSAYFLTATKYGAQKKEKVTILGPAEFAGWLMIKFADGFKIAAPADLISHTNGAK